MQPVRGWGWDISFLAETKMRRGIVIVFRHIKAATKRKAVCSLYLLGTEPEKIGLRLSKGGC